jgi:hypothetical protein
MANSQMLICSHPNPIVLYKHMYGAYMVDQTTNEEGREREREREHNGRHESNFRTFLETYEKGIDYKKVTII